MSTATVTETYGGLTIERLRDLLPDEDVDDIASTAELMIAYWARDASPRDVQVATAAREYGPKGWIYCFAEVDDDGNTVRVHSLSRDEVRQAYGRLLDLDQRFVARRIHNYIIDSYRNRDPHTGVVETADIDGEAADAIFQVATFGEVVYG